jgi:hypothetical protein
MSETGTIDSKHPAEVLEQYRSISHPVILEQAKRFRSLAPADQRELLFHMLAHESITVNKMRQTLETLCPKK